MATLWNNLAERLSVTESNPRQIFNLLETAKELKHCGGISDDMQILSRNRLGVKAKFGSVEALAYLNLLERNV